MKRILVLGVLLALVLTAIGAPVSGKNYSEWSAPANLGPIVNSSTDSDTCPFLTKDGLSLYFARTPIRIDNGKLVIGLSDLWVSQRSSVDDAWGTPQNLGPVINTTDYNERCPYVTPDGHYLIFVSPSRPGGKGSGDFYISYRHDKKDNFAWETPVNITAINTSKDVYAMTGFEEEGTGLLRVYFASGTPATANTTDIYSATMTEGAVFSEPELVNELSSPSDDLFATVSKDGLEIFLTSNRPGGVGSIGLWTSTRKRTTDPWSTPENLGPVVNSSAGESRSALSWDGSTLIFVSLRPGGAGWADLYQTTRSRVTGPKK